MIAPEAGLSVSRQCTLLGIARSSFYYRPRPESAEELELLKRLDRIFTDHPVYGSRRLQVALLREGVSAGRRHIRRLMRKLGLWAVRRKRNTSKRHPHATQKAAQMRATGSPVKSDPDSRTLPATTRLSSSVSGHDQFWCIDKAVA